MKLLSLLFISTYLLSTNSYANNKMVIGADNRIQIKKKQLTEAHESIGMIFFEEDGEFQNCTGTIIGPRHVITAAHCVVPNVINYYFYPGLVSKIKAKILKKIPKEVSKTQKAYRFTGYSKDSIENTDIAILVFDEVFKARPLSLTTQYSSNEYVTISGYPADKTPGTLWEDSGYIGDNSYTIDTYGGQSGSSLRNRNNEVIGIHSYARYGQRKNFASFLNQEHLKFLEKHIN